MAVQLHDTTAETNCNQVLLLGPAVSSFRVAHPHACSRCGALLQTGENAGVLHTRTICADHFARFDNVDRVFTLRPSFDPVASALVACGYEVAR